MYIGLTAVCGAGVHKPRALVRRGD